VLLALCIAAVPRDSAVTRAQRAWVKAHPECAVCGLKRIHLYRCEGHHINPYHLRPDLATCPTNFVTLCRAHHWLVGHGGRSWSYENTNVLATIHAVRVAAGVERDRP